MYESTGHRADNPYSLVKRAIERYEQNKPTVFTSKNEFEPTEIRLEKTKVADVFRDSLDDIDRRIHKYLKDNDNIESFFRERKEVIDEMIEYSSYDNTLHSKVKELVYDEMKRERNTLDKFIVSNPIIDVKDYEFYARDRTYFSKLSVFQQDYATIVQKGYFKRLNSDRRRYSSKYEFSTNLFMSQRSSYYKGKDSSIYVISKDRIRELQGTVYEI